MKQIFWNAWENSVRERGADTALIYRDQCASYGELDRASNRVAHELKKRGVGANDIVPILMPRGIEPVAAMLGVMKSGAAFCMINEGYPEERIAFIRRDTNAKLTIDTSFMAEMTDTDEPFDIPDVTPDAPALVVYTSGSTGNPKGVVIPQRTIEIAIDYRNIRVRKGEVWLNIAPLFFIASIISTLVPLKAGNLIHLTDMRLARDPQALIAYIREHNINYMFAPPQMARQILLLTDGLLRELLVGSERVRGLYSDKTQLVNTYGASETCGAVCLFDIDEAYPSGAPVGFSLYGSKAYVLDDDLGELQAGALGEICISGQIASGYLNLPELTAERFVKNPFMTGEHDATLYRTNDLGYFREDGALVYVQRKDWMLKVRGFRVEPGEIEAAMVKHAPISQAVVTGFENAQGETSLYAVYTAQADVPAETVRDAIEAHLPDYMMPAFIEQIDALPINANGKVDRTKLSPPKAEKFRAEYEPPENDDEAAICGAFQKVLGLLQVGVNDDFLLLGGDSMSAVRLQAELPELTLSAVDILELRTPKKLAQVTKSGLALTHNPPQDSYPLTIAERQMLVSQMIDPKSIEYNVRGAIRIRGALDIERMQSALQALVDRHQVLRSYYQVEGDETVHKVVPTLDVSLRRMRSSEGELSARIDEENVPYDIARAPLFRFTLYEVKPDEFVLSMGFHHIIIDGTCMEVLSHDLWALYLGEELPTIQVNYMDYALWQARQSEDGGDGDSDGDKTFFMDMFKDGVPQNEMPTHPIRSSELPTADLEVTAELDYEMIDYAARMSNVTPYQLLMAAAALTLMKYCGNDDVVIGTAMGGRVLPETAQMMGMFVNTIALRMKLDGAKDGKSFLSAVSALIRSANQHQTYPFDRLVPVLAPERNPSRGPVFDVLVNYLAQASAYKVGNLDIERFPVRTQELAHDLVLEMRYGGAKLNLSLAYSLKLYDEAVVRNMLDQLCIIVQRLCEDPSRPIADLCELPDAQMKQILEDFRGDVVVENRDKTVVDLFREQVARTPEHVAAVYESVTMTYRELDALSDALAAQLGGLGAGRGKTVGILIGRSEWMPVCALGVLKTGAAYMPLDPTYPSERLNFMLEDSGAECVVADEGLKSLVEGFRGQFVFTRNIARTDATQALAKAPTPEDPMVLLYTSGTTGKPKGCMLTHSNLVNFITWYARLNKLTGKDRVLAYASFGFDANMMDMYPILTVGGELHILPEAMRLDLKGIDKYCGTHGITVLFMTTQLGRQFAEQHKNTSVRNLSVGGEALVPIVPPSGLNLYNLYGPTENTIVATGHLVDRLYDRVPIGRATDNVALYVVDKNDRLAPVGVAGELLVSGRQVAMGYLNRPDMTAEKFTPNPFSDDLDYARVYHSGDVVRFLPDGSIDFVGRRDFQVKIRGFRVELTEIESRIRQHPSVRDAAVVALDAPGGGKCAVAYVVGDKKIDVNALNSFIEETLPPYMVPAATVQMDAIPLNPNGKVDRRKLPAPTYELGASGAESPRPLNNLETRLAEITADILGHSRFGLTDNLMRQGLTSLSAIKLIGKVDEAFGVAPSVREFMKAPTLLTLENAVLDNWLDGGTQHEPEIRTQKLEQYPLSHNQLGVYLDAMKAPKALQYNVPFCAILPEGVDAERLSRALCTIIERYPILRCRFQNQNGVIVQIPMEDAARVSMRSMDEAEFEACKRGFVRPFDLETGPMYRAELINAPDATCLLMDFHHIAFDGGSLDLFLHSLDRAYDGQTLPLERMSALDWAAMSAEREGSEAWKEDKAFFDERLKGFEAASELPSDLAKGGLKGQLAEVVRATDRAAVDARCMEWDVTPAALFLAATNLALGRWLLTKDVYISTISSGRSEPKLQNSIGMFVATLPLVLNRKDGQSCREFVKGTADAFRQTIDHEYYPFTRIANDYGYEPSIMYACELGVTARYQIGGKELTLEGLGLSTPKFKLSVHIEERGGETVFAVQYDDARYSRQLMEAFTETLSMALQGLLQNDELPAANLSLMSEAQRARVATFNQTGEPVYGVLHGMFERACAKQPDSIALIAADAQLTYAELNARANRIAHALLERGVKKEDRVALLLKRTSRVLAAMLGVMKAGCAYIPLDPEYPAERIEHVLTDSKSRCMLTTEEFLGAHPDALDIDEISFGQSEENPNVHVEPSQLAYLIYTSGSTGVPKGVMIEHRGIANYCTAHPRNLHVWALAQHCTRMMSITTVAFDMFLKESMTSLCNGVSLVFAPEEATHDPARLAKLFEETGADAFNTTPSIMLEYTNHPGLLAAIAKCKVIMAGAEKYPEVLLDRLLEKQSDALLFNTYGPTEISVSCNCKQLAARGPVTVGQPLLGVHEQVVDADGNALPPLMVGELYIAGGGVARGYNDLPEQTAERFVQIDGRRAYRSGDLARWTLNGEVEILGRNDNQIKLRGLRIELGEIETVLANIKGVRTSAVMIKNIQGGDHICAYYVADRVIDPSEIREQLGKKLTGYMVPTAYKQIEKMPKTPGGKNDLRALPEPELLRLNAYSAPTNELEEAVCDIFQKVLNLDDVGADDSFFDIGGTSLAVTRLVIEAESAGLRDSGGSTISYSDVFTHPSPRELAAMLGGGHAAPVTPQPEAEYDYTAIHALLRENTLDNLRNGQMLPLCDVLLTGATGFLGMHVLHELLRWSPDPVRVTCLARSSHGRSAQRRLQALAFFYFEDDYKDVIDSGRLRIVEGDMTDDKTIASLKDLSFGMVINCAANVSHFARDSHTFDVNVGGVQNLIDLCMARGARLIHVSTASVAGFAVGGIPGRDVKLNEQLLYIGQNLENQYAFSKFMAERAILEACLIGLDAKIMRVGNLMARDRDGQFQINARTNSFLGRMRAFAAVGCFPYAAFTQRTELAPIDSTAQAILLLSRTDKACRVFHPYNNHTIFLGDLVKAFSAEAKQIRMVEGDEFARELNDAMRDSSRAEQLTSLIAYQNMAKGKAVTPIEADNEYTVQALLRQNWSWPETSSEYQRTFFAMMLDMEYGK